MKKLIKNLGYFVLSGVLVVAVACNDASNNDNDAIGNDTTAMNGGGEGTNNNMINEGDNNMNPQGGGTVNNTNASATQGTEGDRAFLSDAIASNIAEVNAHKAAQTKATSKEVKMHAEHMLTDHTQMGKDMMAYAQRKNYEMPSDAPADKKQMLEDMNKNNKGAAWDKAYLDQQVKDHQATIAKFESAQNTVADPELKNMITAALPKLRSHLEMVQSAQKSMK